MINGIESFEKSNMELPFFELKEKLDVMNQSFKTSLSAEKGVYGVTEIIKDDGTVQRTSRNDNGLLFRDYLRDNKIYLRREKLDNGSWKVTQFDDNATPYLFKTIRVTDKTVKMNGAELLPNTKIQKGNFTAIIDMYGRPVMNEITDLSLKNGEGRESLNAIVRDESYRDKDQRGHIIADQLGGPASQENIVAQLDEVNLSKIKQVENIVKDLKQQGNKVDYRIKTNYVGEDKRPTSFEPEIVVNDSKYKLPKELDKIYNDNLNSLEKAKVAISEKTSIPNELGKKTGIEAATITFAISAVDNASKFVQGKISAEDMAVEIVKDTGTAGAVGYGSAFISTAVAQGMSKSSHVLIQSVGKSGAPAAVVSFGVDSFDSVVDYAQGNIDTKELVYDLGDSVAGVAGSALAGAAAGSIVPGAGTVAGFVAGTVGGMVGYAVATAAYKTAAEKGSEGVGILADKAKSMAENTVDQARQDMPEKVSDVKIAINHFAVENNLPFRV